MRQNTTDTKKITKEDFVETVRKFRKMELEKGGSFYDLAVNLINNSFKAEAYILILATWNSGHFRYADFNINSFKEKIQGLEDPIVKMKNKEIKSIDLDSYKCHIETIYTTLAKIKGIKYTGASKVMHLMNPNVFVMWDNYIRGQKLKRYYQELAIVKKGYLCRKRYGDDGESYFQFLKDIQGLFGHLSEIYSNSQANTRTFAKAIDEYNYWNITRPIQKIELQEKRAKGKYEAKPFLLARLGQI